MPFKESKEGQTHYQNDGCGEAEHNKPNNSKRNEISKILVKHNMPTRQVFINEIVRLLDSQKKEIIDMLEEINKGTFKEFKKEKQRAYRNDQALIIAVIRSVINNIKKL